MENARKEEKKKQGKRNGRSIIKKNGGWNKRGIYSTHAILRLKLNLNKLLTIFHSKPEF